MEQTRSYNIQPISELMKYRSYRPTTDVHKGIDEVAITADIGIDEVAIYYCTRCCRRSYLLLISVLMK